MPLAAGAQLGPYEIVAPVGTTWDVAPDSKRFLIELIGAGRNFRTNAVVNWFDELRRRAPAGGR